MKFLVDEGQEADSQGRPVIRLKPYAITKRPLQAVEESKKTPHIILRPGFLACLKGVLRLQTGSLLWLGVPCSLLIFISLGTSQRGIGGYSMWGNTSLESVRKSNVHLARAALCIPLCMARQCWWTVGQPGTSRLPRMPFYEGLLQDDLIPTILQRLSGSQGLLHHASICNP